MKGMVINMSIEWRDEGAQMLRKANEIAVDRPKDEHERWCRSPDDLDYSQLNLKIIFSPSFHALNFKQIDISGYLTADEFVRVVASCVDSISMSNNSGNREHGFCKTLAMASFLGYPPDGVDGKEALKRLYDGKYSISGMNLRILAHIAHQHIHEEMIESLIELDNDDITQIKKDNARIVWFARRILENISLMTEEELRPWGDSFAEMVMCDHIHKNDDGIIDGSTHFWEADELVDTRRIRSDPEKVEELEYKYGRLLSKSEDDWSFIGKLLDLDSHNEWKTVNEMYRPEWYDEKGRVVMAISQTGIAALMGNPDAQFHMGHLYKTGQHGMQQDVEKARYWYNLAAEQGRTASNYFHS